MTDWQRKIQLGDVWESGKAVFGEKSVPIILPRWRVQDIDTPEDWQRAEMMWEIIQQGC